MLTKIAFFHLPDCFAKVGLRKRNALNDRSESALRQVYSPEMALHAQTTPVTENGIVPMRTREASGDFSGRTKRWEENDFPTSIAKTENKKNTSIEEDVFIESSEILPLRYRVFRLMKEGYTMEVRPDDQDMFAISQVTVLKSGKHCLSFLYRRMPPHYFAHLIRYDRREYLDANGLRYLVALLRKAGGQNGEVFTGLSVPRKTLERELPFMPQELSSLFEVA